MASYFLKGYVVRRGGDNLSRTVAVAMSLTMGRECTDYVEKEINPK